MTRETDNVEMVAFNFNMNNPANDPKLQVGDSHVFDKFDTSNRSVCREIHYYSVPELAWIDAVSSVNRLFSSNIALAASFEIVIAESPFTDPISVPFGVYRDRDSFANIKCFRRLGCRYDNDFILYTNSGVDSIEHHHHLLSEPLRIYDKNDDKDQVFDISFIDIENLIEQVKIEADDSLFVYVRIHHLMASFDGCIDEQIVWFQLSNDDDDQ